ncbi:MAG: hypothetical protein QOK04_507 [Solirubrobacteraceae bacterium]|jgi:hypothetical protein|nr:hypothetical protein [Solirubrobacteraceae bacterium]
MPADAKLVAMFAGLHLLGLVMVALLLILFLRSDTDSARLPPEEGDGGGGGNDRMQPRRPGGPRDGGLPLPDADPARIRLRDHRRLADLGPRRARRPAREPEPERVRGPAAR